MQLAIGRVWPHRTSQWIIIKVLWILQFVQLQGVVPYSSISLFFIWTEMTHLDQLNQQVVEKDLQEKIRYSCSSYELNDLKSWCKFIFWKRCISNWKSFCSMFVRQSAHIIFYNAGNGMRMFNNHVYRMEIRQISVTSGFLSGMIRLGVKLWWYINMEAIVYFQHCFEQFDIINRNYL
jgi:hypothetical protein